MVHNRHLRARLMRAALPALGVFLVMATASNAQARTPRTVVNKCSAEEAAAAGALAVAKLTCNALALAAGKPVPLPSSNPCISTAEHVFRFVFEEATDNGDCLSPVDASTIDCKVECAVQDIVCEIAGCSDHLVCICEQ